MTELWNNENPVTDYNIAVPAWIEQDITCYDIAAIIQGGCESGAYMPAVTYHKALATMAEHGDDILNYIEDYYGWIEPLDMKNQSWSGLSCHLLSMAVEIWANSVEQKLEEAIAA